MLPTNVACQNNARFQNSEKISQKCTKAHSYLHSCPPPPPKPRISEFGNCVGVSGCVCGCGSIQVNACDEWRQEGVASAALCQLLAEQVCVCVLKWVGESVCG